MNAFFKHTIQHHIVPFSFTLLIIGALLGMFGSGLTSFAQDGHRRVTLPLPGTSVASVQLQKDALISTLGLAATYNKTCQPKSWDDLYVEHTKVISLPPRNRLGIDPWQEQWLVNVCGQLIPMNIRFIPSPHGGTDYVTEGPKKH